MPAEKSKIPDVVPMAMQLDILELCMESSDQAMGGNVI